MVKELKEANYKELKESIRTTSHQIETINKEIEIVYIPNRNSEVENTITEMRGAQ